MKISCFLLLFSFSFLYCQAQPPLIPYKKGEKWGYCDKYKNIIISCIYTSAAPFSEGLARVGNHKYKMGFITTKGKVAISFQYDWAHSFKNTVAYIETSTEKGNFMGCIDTKGRNIIPPDTFSAGVIPRPELEPFMFGDRLIAVSARNQSYEEEWRVINLEGNTVIGSQYEYIGQFREGLAPVRLEGKAGYINSQGALVIPLKYYTTAEFYEGLGRVRLLTNNVDDDMRQGFVNKRGELVIPMNYYTFANFSEGLVAVHPFETPEKAGYLDKVGKPAIPFVYEKTFDFSEGLAAVVAKGKIGFINKKGKMVIPAIYDYNPENDALIEFYARFRNGLAGVRLEGKAGYINRKGKTIIALKYDDFSMEACGNGVVHGIVKMLLGNERVYVDILGNEYYEK